MSEFDAESGTEALARAVEADNRMWARNPNGTKAKHLRRARDRAILDAVDAGLPLEFIADRMGVLISDVERMATTSRTA